MRFSTTAVSGVLVLVSAVFVISCDGDDSDAGSSPTPSAETREPASDPVDPTAPAATKADDVSVDFRQFARQINDALEVHDIEFFSRHAVTEHVICAPEDVERDDVLATCEEVGQEFESLNLSFWRSGGGAQVPAERVLGLVESLWDESAAGASDLYGDAHPRVHALGANPGVRGGPAQMAVVTAIVNRPQRVEGTRTALILHWRMEDEEWRFFGVLHAAGSAEDFLDPTDTGRSYILDWEPFVD